MSRRSLNPSSWIAWLLLLGLVGCATTQPPEPQVQPTRAVERPAVPSSALYAVDEALADVLSSELHYVGTGRWPGVERSYACAFRNERVLVVNAYCTLKETPAFRIDVYSPTRGRVSLYAEASGGVSTQERASYFSFTAASAPSPAPHTGIPKLALGMSYDELQRHERQRYAAYLPSCFGGERNERPEGACLGSLAPELRAFTARNRSFLEHANADWYRVVRLMRELAARHGREPD